MSYVFIVEKNPFHGILQQTQRNQLDTSELNNYFLYDVQKTLYSDAWPSEQYIWSPINYSMNSIFVFVFWCMLAYVFIFQMP